MESLGQKLSVVLCLIHLLITTQGLSPSSIVTLDVATTVPDNLSDMATITLTCNLNAKNTTLDFFRLMELTISERRGKSKCSNMLAKINLLLPKCTTFGNTNSVTATGALGIDHGHLKVESSKGKDDVDVVDFVCEATYIDHQGLPRVVVARQRNDITKLFSLMASQISALSMDIAHLTATVNALNAPKSCNELRLRRQATSPRQQVTWPDGTKVLCDTETDGGGWTIFQRRVDGKESFARGWTEYVNGFGQLSGDFWMGLEHLHQLMAEGPQVLRVDLAFNNKNYFAQYSTFQVLDASTNYRLRVGGYSGTAGDSLTTWAKNMQFSTYDADHDTGSRNCAGEFGRSGGWFSNCFTGNLNGRWGSTSSQGVIWKSVTGPPNSATFTEMKARPLHRNL